LEDAEKESRKPFSWNAFYKKFDMELQKEAKKWKFK
jgi:hypothetical protein